MNSFHSNAYLVPYFFRALAVPVGILVLVSTAAGSVLKIGSGTFSTVTGLFLNRSARASSTLLKIFMTFSLSYDPKVIPF